jgi:16S rRNA (guanine527-N7)-methyltransferase
LKQLVSLVRQGAAGMELALPESAVDQLASYLDLLVKWNKVYNLTAIRGDEKLVSHHLLDSLAVVRHLPDGNLLDVGSGAGLPGIPIAISCPGRAVTLVDSSQKKAAFLKQAVAELGLATVRVVTGRVEFYQPEELFRTVIARAFSDLADFVGLAGHLCAPDGVMVAMKGIRPGDEIAKLPSSWKVKEIVPLKIPYLEASRHLVFMQSDATTVTS